MAISPPYPLTSGDNIRVYNLLVALSKFGDVYLISFYKYNLVNEAKDLLVLMNGAAAFMLVSLYEGFGLPPLEAMACGTPVIASNISSLPEVVGDAGILVNPYDVDEIAQAIHEVLVNNRLREEMRVKGLERAKQFSWEKTARETLKAYEEVINGNSRQSAS